MSNYESMQSILHSENSLIKKNANGISSVDKLYSRDGAACHSDHFRLPHHHCFLCFGVSFEANGTSASPRFRPTQLEQLQQNNFIDAIEQSHFMSCP